MNTGDAENIHEVHFSEDQLQLHVNKKIDTFFHVFFSFSSFVLVLVYVCLVLDFWFGLVWFVVVVVIVCLWVFWNFFFFWSFGLLASKVLGTIVNHL